MTNAGAGIAQRLERRTRDWKVAGSWHCRSGGRIVSSRANFLCWLLFLNPVHPHVTAAARKTPSSFCQCACGRLQLNTHAPYVCGFAWRNKVRGCMVYTERAETAVVSCGTSHVSTESTPLRWLFKKRAIEKASHSYRITCERSESARERRIVINNNIYDFAFVHSYLYIFL